MADFAKSYETFTGTLPRLERAAWRRLAYAATKKHIRTHDLTMLTISGRDHERRHWYAYYNHFNRKYVRPARRRTGRRGHRA